MDADTLENIYYAIGSLVVAWLVFNGWRQGLVRQFMAMFAVASAYAAAYFGARSMAPMFGFLGYAEPVNIMIGGVTIAMVTYVAIAATSRVMFQKTSQKSLEVRRLWGISGAVLGLIFGCVLFFAATDAVRLLGALAKSNVQAVEEQEQVAKVTGTPTLVRTADISPIINGLAKLSTALNDGSSGEFIKKVDPVPGHVFATLAKLGLIVSRDDAVKRFLAYPGINTLTAHPRLAALSNDPEVDSLLRTRSYFRLLRHEKVIALAGDPEFAAEIKKVNFEEAMDYALKGGDKPPGPPGPPAVDGGP